MPNMVGKAALVIVLVSAASQAASAVDTPCPHPTVTIRVWDALRDQDDVIEAAKGGIVRIFRDAGVGVRWVHCVPEDSLCPWPTGPGEISLRIFRRPEGVGRDTSRETGGVADTWARRRHCLPPLRPAGGASLRTSRPPRARRRRDRVARDRTHPAGPRPCSGRHHAADFRAAGVAPRAPGRARVHVTSVEDPARDALPRHWRDGPPAALTATKIPLDSVPGERQRFQFLEWSRVIRARPRLERAVRAWRGSRCARPECRSAAFASSSLPSRRLTRWPTRPSRSSHATSH